MPEWPRWHECSVACAYLHNRHQCIHQRGAHCSVFQRNLWWRRRWRKLHALCLVLGKHHGGREVFHIVPSYPQKNRRSHFNRPTQRSNTECSLCMAQRCRLTALSADTKVATHSERWHIELGALQSWLFFYMNAPQSWRLEAVKTYKAAFHGVQCLCNEIRGYSML